MKLDNDLRESYRNNDHQFLSNFRGKQRMINDKKDLLKEIDQNPERFQLCKKCKKKFANRNTSSSSKDSTSRLLKQKQIIKVDKTKTVYDEQEIDFINDNQSKIYISYVQVNPFLKYGIRTHYDELTKAHCLHSLFDIFHRDFLLMWIFFIPSLALLWEFIAMYLGISHYYHEVTNFQSTTHNVMMQCSTVLMIMWFFVKTGYYMFYAMSYKTEHTYNKWIKISNMLVIFMNAIFICYALFNK